ncbi:MAG: hypothetical protein PVF58_15345 [Candidatus Methanofastidiosia archaeon]|jgi:hypothetical protein
MFTKGGSESMIIGSAEAEEFLEEIVTEHKTGYLHIEFCDFEFLLFYEEGIPTYGFRVLEGQLFSFSNLSRMVSKLKNARTQFYESPPGVLQALLDKKFGEKIYGDLYTSFTDVGKLFTMLTRNTLTGCVEIDLPTVHCFVVLEKGVIDDIVCCSQIEAQVFTCQHEAGPVSLEYVINQAQSRNGVVRVFERRNPPSIAHPDEGEIFVWSDPRRLKLEFAFGQLGKEFEDLLGQNLTISEILSSLCVDFEEIADMYTYLSAKGYIVTK